MLVEAEYCKCSKIGGSSVFVRLHVLLKITVSDFVLPGISIVFQYILNGSHIYMSQNFWFYFIFLWFATEIGEENSEENLVSKIKSINILQWCKIILSNGF